MRQCVHVYVQKLLIYIMLIRVSRDVVVPRPHPGGPRGRTSTGRTRGGRTSFRSCVIIT